MQIFGVKSSFLKLGILAVQKRELIIEEVHISRFYGIIIRMYFLQSEHNPPHIHAIYNDGVAAIDYMTGEVLEGYLPPKALAMVREWIALHKDTLQEIWETQEFKKIPPLE